MQTEIRQLRIRSLIIDPPLLLAPMEGLTHSAFRQVLAGFGGVGLLSTEMLSAKRLPRDNPGVSPFLYRTENERPLSYQIVTASAAEIPAAVDVLEGLGADVIDLNMGCPSATVGRRGGGIRLMERPDDVRAIVAAARKRTELPVTAKIRLGVELDGAKLGDFCAMLASEGVDLISIHARLKHESFSRNPRWGAIAAVKARVAVPVIANGGIFSVEDAKDCLRTSGADGLMLGRGAVIRPWLFAEIGREVFGTGASAPDVSLPDLYERFLGNLTGHLRPEYRLGRLKQFTHYFAKNYQFGHHLALAVQTSGSVDQARERALAFFERNAE